MRVRHTTIARLAGLLLGAALGVGTFVTPEGAALSRAGESAPQSPGERVAPPKSDERPTPPPPYQTPVNFSSPPRAYENVPLGNWTVLVEKQLLDAEKDLAQRALDRLRRQLDELVRIFPKPAQVRFSKLTLFLMFGERAAGGGRNNGLEYFQEEAPRHDSRLDPKMANSILIYSAENYVWLPERRALMALVHEFAHAYQLEQWPENEPRIYEAWTQAMQRGLYRHVKDENGEVLAQGYATVNQLEYFAEVSMVFFVGGYYTPFDRGELRTYDPAGYEMVRKLWNIADDSNRSP